MDAQTVKARVRGCMQDRGYDGHKRIKGTSCHLATDLRGEILRGVCSPAKAHASRPTCATSATPCVPGPL